MKKWVIAGLMALLWAVPVSAQVGPSALVECPVGATELDTMDDIPAIVWAASNGASFKVLAGVHTPDEPINMREGQTLCGEFGAIIDGSAVVQGFDLPSTSIVRGWGCSVSCSNVTVRNLVIFGLADYNCVGIVGNGAAADNWTVDHNEIYGCAYGVNVGFNDTTTFTFNFIHDNDTGPESNTGGYGGNETIDLLFEDNFFASNGRTQKVSISDGTTFRRNRFLNDVLWLDGDNINWLLELNNLNGCGGESQLSIHIEISALGIIRYNRINNCPGTGIFLSTVRDTQVYENILDGNNRGLNTFVNCDAVFPPDMPQPGNIGWDTNDLDIHDNVVFIYADDTRVAEFTSVNCDAMEVEPYLDGTKMINFENNAYYVPNTAGTYWEWGTDITNFTTWQGEGRDDTGSVSTFRPPPPPPPDPEPLDEEPPTLTLTAARVGNSPQVRVRTTCVDNVGCVQFELVVDSGVVSRTTGDLTLRLSRSSHRFTATGWDAAGNSASLSVTLVR